MDDIDPLKALDREQLRTLGPYSRPVAEMLLDQGTIAIQDLLDTKKQYETKAIALLTAFTQIALAEIGATFIAQELIYWDSIFIMSGVLFSFAAFACAWSLREMRYGSPGIDPREWLMPRHLIANTTGDATTGDEAKTARLAAILAHDAGLQLAACRKANAIKMNLVSAAIFLGLGALAVALLGSAGEIWFKPR
jgi:hypothetical protein